MSTHGELAPCLHRWCLGNNQLASEPGPHFKCHQHLVSTVPQVTMVTSSLPCVNVPEAPPCGLIVSFLPPASPPPLTTRLNIQPPDLFFYAFLPPLLVDSAIRIDFFMFRKVRVGRGPPRPWNYLQERVCDLPDQPALPSPAHPISHPLPPFLPAQLSLHAVMMAFVMVVLSALILTPLILFVLGFQDRGWSWVHGALFASMIAPTDALAAAAILKQGMLCVVRDCEGERPAYSTRALPSFLSVLCCSPPSTLPSRAAPDQPAGAFTHHISSQASHHHRPLLFLRGWPGAAGGADGGGGAAERCLRHHPV